MTDEQRKPYTAPHLQPYHFKPGQSGNPLGRGALSRELHSLRSQARDESLEAIGRTLLMTKGQLQAIAADPNATMVELLVASIMQKAIRDGCSKRAEFLMSYILGKAPTYEQGELPDPAAGARELLSAIPSSILIDLVKVSKGSKAEPIIDSDK